MYMHVLMHEIRSKLMYGFRTDAYPETFKPRSLYSIVLNGMVCRKKTSRVSDHFKNPVEKS